MPPRAPRVPAEEEPVRIAIALPADSVAKLDEIGKRLATGSRGRTIQVVVDTVLGTKQHIGNARRQAEEYSRAAKEKDADGQQAAFIGVLMHLAYITNELTRLVGEVP
jgi:hypothetical protein